MVYLEGNDAVQIYTIVIDAAILIILLSMVSEYKKNDALVSGEEQ